MRVIFKKFYGIVGNLVYNQTSKQATEREIMKTVFTFVGSNPFMQTREAMIELRQSEDKQGRFILTYGCEVTAGLTYSKACVALGQAVMHHLACESVVNNGGV